MSPLRRVGVPLVGGLAVLAVAAGLLQRFYADPAFLRPHDFLEYYAAGKLLLAGGDPYDANQLRPVQLAAGRHTDTPVMMWNPPWSLTVVAPFSLPDPRTGQLLWLAAQVLGTLAAAVALWRLYGGPPRLVPAVVLVAALFPPLGYVMTAGQSGGWLFVGVAGLALAAGHDRPWLATLAALAALKPHLFLPIWITLALDATCSPKSRKLLGWGMAAGLVMTLLPLLAEPHVWANYLRALRRPADDTHPPLSGWRNPLIGFFVRDAIDITKFWIQWVPTGLLVLATPVYWWTRRHRWDWPGQLPVLILAGMIAAPYGAWEHDLTVLLLPLIAIAARLVPECWTPRTVGLAVGYLLWCGGAALISTSEYFVWMAPTAATGYWVASRPARITPVPGVGPGGT